MVFNILLLFFSFVLTKMNEVNGFYLLIVSQPVILESSFFNLNNNVVEFIVDCSQLFLIKMGFFFYGLKSKTSWCASSLIWWHQQCLYMIYQLGWLCTRRTRSLFPWKNSLVSEWTMKIHIKCVHLHFQRSNKWIFLIEFQHTFCFRRMIFRINVVKLFYFGFYWYPAIFVFNARFNAIFWYSAKRRYSLATLDEYFRLTWFWT